MDCSEMGSTIEAFTTTKSKPIPKSDKVEHAF